MPDRVPDADHAEATSTEPHKMNYVKNVIIFCVLIVIIPAILIIIPIYLWAGVFDGAVYPVAESEILEIRDGISSIFCQQHTLEMSTNFNAFQLPDKPEISTNREHVRLEKSITLPHNTIKYFGFHILKDAEVVITFCSRYDGSQLAIVQGGKKLETCELQDYNKNKVAANLFEHTAKIGNRSEATENESSSTSSFEKSLFDCYKESIDIPQSPPLPSSETCTSTDLIKNGAHMSTRSNFIEDGFYYYMFYSDNDLVQNDIHAIFEIYKPTFQYSNSTDTSKSCLNSTNCTFPISFLSNEIVVVEVPIRDGIQHGDHDNYLVSTCHPRMAVYAIFPISMLVLLLSYLFFCLVRLRSRKERNPTPS